MQTWLRHSVSIFSSTFMMASSFAGAPPGAGKPYPLLPTTPAYVCQNLLLGAKYGKPISDLGRNLFESLIGQRYQIETVGLESVLIRGNQGILFLPNHTGYIDPLIMMAAISGDTNVRPVMTEDMAKGAAAPVMKRLVGGVNALLLPNAGAGGKTAASLVQAILNEVDNATRNGDNILLYPSGRTQSSGFERLGNNSAVEQLILKDPNRRIVLVRQRGLWGSSWTRGAEGENPNSTTNAGQVLKRGLLTGLTTLLANGFVLTPKRPVSLEFFEPTDFPRNGTRQEMNAYMERFYNSPVRPEKRTFVRQFFWQVWKKKIRVVESEEEISGPVKGRSEVVELDVPALDKDLGQNLLKLAKSIMETQDLTIESNLRDAGLDSLNTVSLLMAIHETFNVEVPEQSEFSTLRDLAHIINAENEKVAAEKARAEAASRETSTAHSPTTKMKPSERWFQNSSSDEKLELIPDASTVTEMIVKRAFMEPDKIISEDQMRGENTYQDLLVKSLAMSSAIESIEGDRLGLLLPASAGGTLVYTATHLAGKVPVYVNFTAAPEAIIASLDSIGVKKILTSRSAVSTLAKNYDMSKYLERFVYLEDLSTKIKLAAPLALLKVKLAPELVLAQSHRTEYAVILFTSGSSGSPKAVGLTHANILANVRDVMNLLHLKKSDRMLSFLPPFHSFGHMTQVMSLVLGLPTVYHVKPTDGQTLANIIDSYRPTIVAGTPSFMEGIAQKSRTKLDSIRLLFTGAEALKPEQMSVFKSVFTHAEVLEGYGTTELSPIVSANPPGAGQLGSVGKILASLNYKIVGVESGEEVQPGESGLLMVRGPSVFNGYLNVSNDTTFVKLKDGLSYYNTGDVVTEDQDGYIRILGRLGRFRKIKGEMVSLPALESALSALIEPLRPKNPDGTNYAGPLLAVESLGDNQPLVLFTTVDLTTEQVQRFQREKATPGIQIISEVRKVTEIPMLGTGKADYKTLQNELKK